MANDPGQADTNNDPVAQGTVDLLLDARQLKVEEISLSLAKVLNLKVKNLEAELLLKADLEEVATVLRRLVSTLGENPDLLKSLLQTLSTTVEEAAEVVTDGTEPSQEDRDRNGFNTRLIVDAEGDLVETTLDENDRIAGEETVGSLEETEITDAAGRKARELGVDLSSVEGTGQDGRILVRDVEAAGEAG